MSELLKYAVGATITLQLRKAGTSDLAVAADWTPVHGGAAGTDDVQVSIDGGAFANSTNAPAYTNGRWGLLLDTTELTGRSILVRTVDDPTKTVDDDLTEIKTYGHASAYYPGDFGDAATMGVWGATTRALTDKAGFALSGGEHTAIATDAQAGLTAQGYTPTRAGYLDTLNGLVAAIWANGTRTLSSFGTLVSDIWANATRTLSSLGSSAVDEIWNRLRSATSHPSGSFGFYLDAPISGVSGGGGGPDAATIADAVWDEVLSGHTTAGTAGESLNTDLVDAIFAHLTETGLTFEHFCQNMQAVINGKIADAGTGTESFRDYADTKDRVVVTTDSAGDRSEIVRDYD